MNEQEEAGVYKKKGAAQESPKQEKTDDLKDMEGGMKEAGDVPGKSGVAQRMGFTQNFGAARQNSYAKGAAKVSSIMNDGPAQTDAVSGNFSDAFSSAGGKNFTFKGKEYSGLTKEAATSQVASGTRALGDERKTYANPSENLGRLGGYNHNYQYESGIRRQSSINSINQGLSALGKSASGESVSPEFDVKSQQTYMQDTPSGYKGTDSEGKDYVHTKDPFSKK